MSTWSCTCTKTTGHLVTCWYVYNMMLHAIQHSVCVWGGGVPFCVIGRKSTKGTDSWPHAYNTLSVYVHRGWGMARTLTRNAFLEDKYQYNNVTIKQGSQWRQQGRGWPAGEFLAKEVVVRAWDGSFGTHKLKMGGAGSARALVYHYHEPCTSHHVRHRA